MSDAHTALYDLIVLADLRLGDLFLTDNGTSALVTDINLDNEWLEFEIRLPPPSRVKFRTMYTFMRLSELLGRVDKDVIRVERAYL